MQLQSFIVTEDRLSKTEIHDKYIAGKAEGKKCPALQLTDLSEMTVVRFCLCAVLNAADFKDRSFVVHTVVYPGSALGDFCYFALR